MIHGRDSTAPERRLAAERKAAEGRVQTRREEFHRLVDAAGSTTLDDEHDPEGATIAFERGQLGALIEQAEQALRDVDDAIARVADGTYGVCRVCGGVIGVGRLDALPAAAICIECADPGRARSAPPVRPGRGGPRAR